MKVAHVSLNGSCCAHRKSGGKTAALQKTLVQFAEPDVAVADWVIVVLQGERNFFRSRA